MVPSWADPEFTCLIDIIKHSLSNTTLEALALSHPLSYMQNAEPYTRHVIVHLELIQCNVEKLWYWTDIGESNHYPIVSRPITCSRIWWHPFCKGCEWMTCTWCRSQSRSRFLLLHTCHTAHPTQAKATPLSSFQFVHSHAPPSISPSQLST